MLEIGGHIVHTREHQNARLGRKTERLLQRFADEMMFEVVPDARPIEVYASLDLGQTEVRLCRRLDLVAKDFASLILPGALNSEVADRLAAVLGGRHIDLVDAALEALVEFGAPYVEIVALVSTDRVPAGDAPSLDEVIARIRDQAPVPM